MTKKWFSQTRDPPRIPIFYTLTKIHKPNPVGRPIISALQKDYHLLLTNYFSPSHKTEQKSYLKDTTDFVNFIEKTRVTKDTILVSMDVTSLYTNIPKEEEITTVSKAYETFHNNKPPIPSHYLKEMLKIILEENSFEFVRKKITLRPMELQWVQKWPLHLQTSLWPILKQKSIEKTKPIECKRFIDDIFSLWDSDKKEINLFIEQANKSHPTI